MDGSGCNERFGRLVYPKLNTIIITIASRMAIKTILARVTKDIPSSLSVAAIAFAKPTNSSGESWLVKASLKVMDAVARDVAIAPATICGKRENPLLVSDWMFHRYVTPTRTQRVSL
jgi:hypothetical protein